MTIQNTGTASTDVILSFGAPLRGNETVGGLVQFVDSQGKRTDEYIGTVPRRSAISVAVVFSLVSSSGTIEVPVFNHGDPIGEISVLRYPFGITLENPAATLAVNGDAPATLTLVNADPVPYAVTAILTVAGQPLCAEPLGARPVRSCLLERLPFGNATTCQPPSVTIPANQKITIDFFPNCAISSGVFTGLLKDEQRPARLSVVHGDSRNPAAGAGSETMPVGRAELSFPLTATIGYGFLSEFWRQIWSTIVIGIVLALGGIASVLARYWVPNEVARHRLLEKLERFDLRASDLSENVGSELRVAVRVNAKRITDLLKSLPAISADTSALLSGYEKQFQSMELKFDRLDQLDTAWQRLWQVVPEGPALSAVRAIERRLRKAAQFLEPPVVTTLELESARTTIEEALVAIEALPALDDAFRTEARARLDDLKTSFDTEPGLKGGAKAEELRKLLPGPFGLLDSQQPVDSWFDLGVGALELIREYLRLFSVSTDPTTVERLQSREPELVRSLSSPSASKLRDARLLLRQMREAIFESDIAEALRERQLSIECDPKTFGSYQLVRLYVRLHRPDLNGVAARERFTCLWHFPDQDPNNPTSEAQSTERGWEIRHYFVGGRSATESRVEVTFLDPTGKPVVRGTGASDSDGELARVETILATGPEGARRNTGRMRAEWVGLVVVLFIALLGLITGAREQITKLDMVPGFIAVFLLGFGADAVKSLLTQRTDAPTPTP